MTIKLGPGIHYSTAAALQFARSAPIVKQRDEVSALKAAPLGAVTVFRHVFPQENQDIYANGADIGRTVLNALGGFKPTYVELYNETAQRLGQGLERYTQMIGQAVPVIHNAGIGVAGFSFSTGVPEATDWQYIQSQGFAGCDVVAIHEYWGNQGFTVWNALRHRTVHGWLNGNHPPFVITECGRDAVEGGMSGWRISGVNAQQYVAELLAYDAEIAKDNYVIGATIFEAGSQGDMWWNFDIDELVPAILQAGPIPQPPPVRGQGRVPWTPILLFGLAGMLGTYALIASMQEEA